MTVAAYTDLLNEALDDLCTQLATITGIKVVNDPRNIQGTCVFVNAPSFTAWNANIVKLAFPVQIIVPGPYNLDAQRTLMNIAALLLSSNVGVIDGKPTSLDIGGTVVPAFELNINLQAQTS